MTAEARRWSTENALPGETLSYWIDAICEAFLEMKAESPESATFSASIEQHAFGPIDLNFADTTCQKVWRTPHAIAGSRKHTFYLLYMREGRLAARQRGREAKIEPGDCVLIDGMQPYSFSFPQANRCLSVQMPGEWLQYWIPSADAIVATPLASRAGWGRTLASALGSLAERRFGELALPRATVADQLGALLALAGGHMETAPPARGRQLLQQIRATLLERLHDPSLDPQMVAVAHGISLRYLHLLFARAGTTFGNAVMEIRLERARHMLENPRHGRTGIAEIAWQCGFREPSHFARRFRARFGLPPAAFRKALHS